MFESRLWRSVPDTTLCDKVCQWLAAGRWFSPGTRVSSTNKTYQPRYNWNFVESGVKHHNPNYLYRNKSPLDLNVLNRCYTRGSRFLLYYILMASTQARYLKHLYYSILFVYLNRWSSSIIDVQICLLIAW